MEELRANSGAVNFTVVSPTKTAYLGLYLKDDPGNEIFRIKLGNETNIIDKTNINELKSKTFETPNMFEGDSRDIWMTFYNGVIKIGFADHLESVLEYNYKKENQAIPFIGNIKFYHLNIDTDVKWIYDSPPDIFTPKEKEIDCGELKWARMEGNNLPADALIGGFENEPIYIARAHHNNSLCPGKYVKSKQMAFIPWGFQEHAKNEFEILCGFNMKWVKTRGRNIPLNAFVGGYSEVRREPLYIGRARHDGNLICGKVHVLYSTCYLPYNGKEVEFHEYEILVSLDTNT